MEDGRPAAVYRWMDTIGRVTDAVCGCTCRRRVDGSHGGGAVVKRVEG